MINGIHHISMKCSCTEEYSKVKSFYADILKIKIMKECDTCTLFDTGSGIVEVFKDGTGAPDKGIIRHFAFSTDDVEACANAVKSAGYEVFIEPKNINIGGDSAYPAKISFCRGPLGEEIEFFHQMW